MNWSSFTAGSTFGAALLLSLWLTLPPVQPEWRQCAPSQEGEVLVSTSQYPDHTDCNYAKKPTGRVIQRKKVVS